MCENNTMVYLDHAATSFPKPPSVISAATDFMVKKAINPGRAGYDLAIEVNQEIDEVREALGQFFNNPANNLNHTVFTSNATDALNLAISGFCRPGDHIVSTNTEHNSVLRPLHMLSEAGIIDFDLVSCDSQGLISAADIEAAITSKTRLVIMNHASNVVGTIQPVAEVGALCRNKGVTFLLDAAQSAGSLPIDMTASCIDLLAFTGHKGLQASPGIGGLIIGPEVTLKSTRWGGTGVQSALLTQPEELPYKLESGTINGPGVMSLGAGLKWVQAQNKEVLLKHERKLAHQFVTGCIKLPHITLHGHGNDGQLAQESFAGETHMPVISLTVDGLEAAAVGMFLDVDWNIAVRTGLQCAPLIHQTLGTYPEGTVRFSFGPGNTENDVELALRGLAAIS